MEFAKGLKKTAMPERPVQETRPPSGGFCPVDLEAEFALRPSKEACWQPPEWGSAEISSRSHVICLLTPSRIHGREVCSEHHTGRLV